jgi:hypothetical protein
VHHGLVVGIEVERRLVAAAVARTDGNRADARQDVELGDAEVRERVDSRGVAQADEVDPADAAGAARRRPVLAAGLADLVAQVVVEL